MFDLIKEAFDEVSSFVEMCTEADWLLSVGFKRDAGLSFLRVDQIANYVGVMASIGQQNGPR